MKSTLITFFQALPKRVKVVLHLVELLLCFYAATSVVLLFTPLAPFVKPYLEGVAVAFLLLFPLVHVLVEFAFADPTPSDLPTVVGDTMTQTLINLFRKNGQSGTRP